MYILTLCIKLHHPSHCGYKHPHAAVRTLALWIHCPYAAVGLSHYECTFTRCRTNPRERYSSIPNYREPIPMLAWAGLLTKTGALPGRTRLSEVAPPIERGRTRHKLVYRRGSRWVFKPLQSCYKHNNHYLKPISKAKYFQRVNSMVFKKKISQTQNGVSLF